MTSPSDVRPSGGSLDNFLNLPSLLSHFLQFLFLKGSDQRLARQVLEEILVVTGRSENDFGNDKLLDVQFVK